MFFPRVSILFPHADTHNYQMTVNPNVLYAANPSFAWQRTDVVDGGEMDIKSYIVVSWCFGPFTLSHVMLVFRLRHDPLNWLTYSKCSLAQIWNGTAMSLLGVSEINEKLTRPVLQNVENWCKLYWVFPIQQYTLYWENFLYYTFF